MPIPSSARPIIAAVIAWSATVAPAHATVARQSAEQPPGHIRGVVTLAETGAPLATAAVTIRGTADSALITGVLTTEDGQFQVDGLTLGAYAVHVSHLGFASQTVDNLELTADAPVGDVGVIALEADAVELGEIQAQAQRSPVVIEVDRTVYSADDLPSSAAGTAHDLLRDIPELDVDANGRVRLRGQLVAIHLNGRPSALPGDALLNFLQQLPADRLATIEVMPNPSARHDPEGMGGIVNLILDQNVGLGLSGSLSARGSTRGQNIIGADLAYQRGPLTVFGYAGLSLEEFLRKRTDTRQNLLAEPPAASLIGQQGEETLDNTSRTLDVTTELKIGGRTTAWFQALTYGIDGDNGLAMLYDLSDASGDVLNRYNRSTATDHGSTVYDITFGLDHAIAPQAHELNFDVRYNRRDGRADVSVDQTSMLDPDEPIEETLLTDRDYENGELAVHADYMRPLGEGGRLEVGVDIKRRNWDEDYIQELFLASGVGALEDQNLYAYDESYSTVYLIVSRQFGKFGIQLGARAEDADNAFKLRTPADDTFDIDYRTIFPSVNVSWDAGAGRRVGFSYWKRVARPSAELLNPRTPNYDPLNLAVGNPFLGPAFVNSFSLDFSKIGSVGTLQFSPYLRRTVDSWEQIKRVDSLGVSTVTFENSSSYERLGASATGSLRVGRWSGSANVDVARAVVNASNVSPDFDNTSIEWTAGLNGSAQVTDGLSAQLSARFWPARPLPQGRQSASFDSSIGLRQQLLNGRATLSLLARDPLDLAEFTFETRGRGYSQISRTENKLQSLALSFIYRFGRSPDPSNRQREDHTVSGQTGERLR